MTMKFNVGDVVRLKSGGPEMTVFVISPDSSRPIYCSWFNGATILHHGDDSKLTGFKAEMLDLVRSASTPYPSSPQKHAPACESFVEAISDMIDERFHASLAALFASLADDAAKQSDRFTAALDKVLAKTLQRALDKLAKEDSK